MLYTELAGALVEWVNLDKIAYTMWATYIPGCCLACQLTPLPYSAIQKWMDASGMRTHTSLLCLLLSSNATFNKGGPPRYEQEVALWLCRSIFKLPMTSVKWQEIIVIGDQGLQNAWRFLPRIYWRASCSPRTEQHQESRGFGIPGTWYVLLT